MELTVLGAVWVVYVKHGKHPSTLNNNVNIAWLPCLNCTPKFLPTLQPTHPNFTHCPPVLQQPPIVLASNLTIAGGHNLVLSILSLSHCQQLGMMVVFDTA
jgi:hypothetical protein